MSADLFSLPIWAQASILRSREGYRDAQRLREALGMDANLDYVEACEAFWSSAQTQQALAPLLSRRLWQPLALLRALIEDVRTALNTSLFPLPPTATLTPEGARAIKARAVEWRYGSTIEFADPLEAGLERDAEVYRVASMAALRARGGWGLDALEREVEWARCRPAWITREGVYYLVVIPRALYEEEEAYE